MRSPHRVVQKTVSRGREFDGLTFNGTSFPRTAALIIERTDAVPVRFGNLSPYEATDVTRAKVGALNYVYHSRCTDEAPGSVSASGFGKHSQACVSPSGRLIVSMPSRARLPGMAM